MIRRAALLALLALVPVSASAGDPQTTVGSASSPYYSVTFNAGASVGLTLQEFDGTAYNTAADAVNIMSYKGEQWLVTSYTIASGTITPAAEANGVDICAGAPANNDGIRFWQNLPFITSRPPLVAGRDAFRACFTFIFHEPTGTDSFFCGVAALTAVPGTDALVTYNLMGFTSAAAAVRVLSTDSGVQSSHGTWDVDAQHEMCVSVNIAGSAFQWAYDGGTPITTATQAFTAGSEIATVCEIRQDTGVAQDSWWVSASVTIN